MSDDEALENMEIDLEVAEVGEILEAHGMDPSADLVTELWTWMESLRAAAHCEGCTGGDE